MCAKGNSMISGSEFTLWFNYSVKSQSEFIIMSCLFLITSKHNLK